MGLFSRFKKSKLVEAQGYATKDSLQGIFDFVRTNVDGEGRLKESGDELPDEDRRYKEDATRWAPGAMDGTIGHHGGIRSDDAEVRRIVELMRLISIHNGLVERTELYALLAKDNVMGFVDTVLDEVVESNISIYPHLHTYAQWLAFKGVDRGAVKFGIALLGVIGDEKDLDNIIILGKHEEFTLFAAVAVTHTLVDAEQTLWSMAKCVYGWGRIHLVERLAGTEDVAIKAWLLRQGYKNTVMHEYLAYTCAVAGNLKEELQRANVSDDVLHAAGDIIAALINGGPAEDMPQYDDGAEVTQLYVAHLEKRANTLSDFLKLAAIKHYLESEDIDWDGWEEQGWHIDLRSDLLIDLHTIITNKKWARMVLEKQSTADAEEFSEVDEAAEILGISLWEARWRRLLANPADPDHWSSVMKNANDERIDDIIGCALTSLPLNEIATGAANEIGHGEDYSLHQCMDYILQHLGDYPGKGFDLVRTALESPVTRNRNLAIRVLSAWGMDHWPPETQALLAHSGKVEPNKNTRKNIINVLSGRNPE